MNELPEPLNKVFVYGDHGPQWCDALPGYYSAEQMRDYALAALRASREPEVVAYIEEYTLQDSHSERHCRGLVWADHPHNTPGRTFTPLTYTDKQPDQQAEPVAVSDAMDALAGKLEAWTPTANPIGPLHGAGMAFAYKDAAQAIRAALTAAASSAAQVGTGLRLG